MLACGALRDPSLLPKYEGLLFPKGESKDAMASDTVAVAATWSVAKLGDRRTQPLLRRILQGGTPDMRAFAALGLGALKDRANATILAQTARSLDAGSVARAAAAYALGELGAESEATTLVTIAAGESGLAKPMALLALARLGAAKGEPPGGGSALSAIADGLFVGDGDGARATRALEQQRKAAAAALVMLATRSTGDKRETLSVPDETVDAEATLYELVPDALPPEARARALVTFKDPILRAAQVALSTSGDRARAVLDAMSTQEGAFEPLIAREEVPKEARTAAVDIARALEPSVIELARHPDPTIRTKALVILGRSASERASAALAGALGDPSENVQRVALAALGKSAGKESLAAASRALRTHESWAMRVLACEALGRLGKAGAGNEAASELETAARKDPYALVREAALKALGTFDAPAATSLAKTMADSDPEPRVRETAKARARVGAP